MLLFSVSRASSGRPPDRLLASCRTDCTLCTVVHTMYSVQQYSVVYPAAVARWWPPCTCCFPPRRRMRAVMGGTGLLEEADNAPGALANVCQELFTEIMSVKDDVRALVCRETFVLPCRSTAAAIAIFAGSFYPSRRSWSL